MRRREIDTPPVATTLRHALAVILFVPAFLATGNESAGPLPDSPRGEAAALDDTLATDSGVEMGRLENGLTFYIRRNTIPEKRIELRLVVRAGSLMENDSEQGLAHFLEHMAFVRSRSFGAGSVMSEMESMGSRRAADVNASTGVDRTVYRLHAPSDRDSLIERSFRVLADFAFGLDFPPEEIERERSVVMEEWRTGLDAATRLWRKHATTLYSGSPVAVRDPIGKPEIVSGLTREQLLRFYGECYTPDRMAVVVVGDIDPDQARALIRRHFGAAPARTGRRPLVSPDLPDRSGTSLSIASDPEASGSSVQIYAMRSVAPIRTARDLRDRVRENLCLELLNRELRRGAIVTGGPVVQVTAHRTALAGGTSALLVSAMARDGAVREALQVLLLELERAAQHGFDSLEVAQTASDLAGQSQARETQSRSLESSDWVVPCVSHFVDGEPLIDPALREALTRRFLGEVTPQDLTLTLETLTRDRNRVVLVSVPAKQGLAVPTEAELGIVLRDAGSTQTLAGPPGKRRAGLEVSLPTPGRVLDRRTIEEAGLTLLHLSNGVEVWLKPTSFDSTEVLIEAFASGGSLAGGPNHFLEARYAVTLAPLGNAGGWLSKNVRDQIRDKPVSGKVEINETWRTVACRTTPEALETALQVVYLTFRHMPSANPYSQAFEAFRNWKRDLTNSIGNRKHDPGWAFDEALRAVNRAGHFSSDRYRDKSVAEMALKPALDFYTRSFGNAADFRFAIVGAFEPDAIVPLVEQYLATLPSTGVRSAWPPVPELVFPEKPVMRTVHAGSEPVGRVCLSWPTPRAMGWEDWQRLIAMGLVLEMHLNERLRDQLGATYHVQVWHDAYAPPYDYGVLGIEFGCDPEKIAALTERVLSEVEWLRHNDVDADLLRRFRETQIRVIEESTRRNSFWMNRIERAIIWSQDPAVIASAVHLRVEVDAPEIRETLVRACPRDRFTCVTLLREESSGH